MALVDGSVDAPELAIVAGEAAALDIHPDYLSELIETVRGHIEWVVLDMMRVDEIKQAMATDLGPQATP